MEVVTAVPTAVEGDSQRIALWVQVLTGMELDDHDVFHPLTADEWQERKRRLEGYRGSTLR
jgi:hypothetical protein